MSAVERFSRNEAGRDFVVGDIHGCFTLLKKLLKLAEFDKAKDRLFSVGDLVDRGPESMDALSWLLEPWFHAVRANHEQMAINFEEGHNHPFHYERNGGRWFIDLEANWQREYAEAFKAMPIVIEVGLFTGVHSIGIVHAEVVGDSWRDFCAKVEAGESGVINEALWGRNRILYKDETPVFGVSRVYVGHTPCHEVMTLGNVVYIDTGAVFGMKLTMIDINSGEIYECQT